MSIYKYKINGGKRLHGEVEISGAKNAAVAINAADAPSSSILFFPYARPVLLRARFFRLSSHRPNTKIIISAQ